MKIKHVYGNVLRIDIPLTIKIINSEIGETHEVEEPFYPDTSKPVLVELANQYNITKYTYEATIDGNVAHIEDYGNIRVGVYKVTVKCFDEYNQPYRYMVRDIIEICDATIDAGVEAGIEFDSETYTLEGAYFIKGEKGDKGDDGVGIVSVEQIVTSHESSGINVVRVTLTNGVKSDFEIRNGAQASISVVGETLKFN